MRHITSTGHHHTLSAAAWIIGALWIVAGIATAMALGGGLTRVAVVLAAVITEWWLVSQLEDRFGGNIAGSHAPTGQRGAKDAVRASWRDRSAA